MYSKKIKIQKFWITSTFSFQNLVLHNILLSFNDFRHCTQKRKQSICFKSGLFLHDYIGTSAYPWVMCFSNSWGNIWLSNRPKDEVSGNLVCFQLSPARFAAVTTSHSSGTSVFVTTKRLFLCKWLVVAERPNLLKNIPERRATSLDVRPMIQEKCKTDEGGIRYWID